MKTFPTYSLCSTTYYTLYMFLCMKAGPIHYFPSHTILSTFFFLCINLPLIIFLNCSTFSPFSKKFLKIFFVPTQNCSSFFPHLFVPTQKSSSFFPCCSKTSPIFTYTHQPMLPCSIFAKFLTYYYETLFHLLFFQQSQFVSLFSSYKTIRNST